MSALTTRAERVAEAQRLRAEGLLLREIAERMGSKLKTVHAWLNDPDLSKHRARLASYAGTCVDCGVPTCGHDGPNAEPSERCIPCNGKYQRALTRQYILDSFAEWHRLFGVPPAAYEWNPSICRSHSKRPDDCYARGLARHLSTGRPWPPSSSVINHFGSWNGGLRAAGMRALSPSERHIGHRGIAARDEDRVAA